MNSQIPVYKPESGHHRKNVQLGKDYKQLLRAAAKKNPKLYKEYLTQSEYEKEDLDEVAP